MRTVSLSDTELALLVCYLEEKASLSTPKLANVLKGIKMKFMEAV